MFHWRALSCLRWLWDADYYQASSSCLSWLSISILGHVSVNCALSILTKHPFTFSIWMVQTSENNSRFLRKFAQFWSRSLDCIWYFKTCRENLAKLRGGEIIFPLLTKARRSIDGYLTSWAVLSLSRSACSQESLRVKPLPLGCCGNAIGVLMTLISHPWSLSWSHDSPRGSCTYPPSTGSHRSVMNTYAPPLKMQLSAITIE